MEEIFSHIRQKIQNNATVLFMKGNALRPYCGFSRTVVDVLTHLEVSFCDIDILENPDLRQGLKLFSQWPTFPQLYHKGEFIGGCDIVCQLYESGKLQEILGQRQSPKVITEESSHGQHQ